MPHNQQLNRLCLHRFTYRLSQRAQLLSVYMSDATVVRHMGREALGGLALDGWRWRILRGIYAGMTKTTFSHSFCYSCQIHCWVSVVSVDCCSLYTNWFCCRPMATWVTDKSVLFDRPLQSSVLRYTQETLNILNWRHSPLAFAWGKFDKHFSSSPRHHNTFEQPLE